MAVTHKPCLWIERRTLSGFGLVCHNSFRMERHFLHSDKADIITPVKLQTSFLPAHTDLHCASGPGLEWRGHSEVPELPRTCGAFSATAILFPDPGNFRAADLPKSSGKHLLLNNQNSEKTFQSHGARLWRFKAGSSSLLNQCTISHINKVYGRLRPAAYQIKFPSLLMQELRSIRDGNIKRFKDSVAELTKWFWCLNYYKWFF